MLPDVAPKAKEWKAGCADEVWKAIIYAADIARAEELISLLCSILIVGDHPATIEAKGAALRRFTSGQIIDGVLEYRAAAVRSVEKALIK